MRLCNYSCSFTVLKVSVKSVTMGNTGEGRVWPWRYKVPCSICLTVIENNCIARV
jgi:hypothetical protein